MVSTPGVCYMDMRVPDAECENMPPLGLLSPKIVIGQSPIPSSGEMGCHFAWHLKKWERVLNAK